jgi:hypothetical protein
MLASRGVIGFVEITTILDRKLRSKRHACNRKDAQFPTFSHRTTSTLGMLKVDVNRYLSGIIKKNFRHLFYMPVFAGNSPRQGVGCVMCKTQ